MNNSNLSDEEWKKVADYLNENMWPQNLPEIKCPICGGIITGKYISTSYEAKCSTPGCFYYSVRGI